ncbi:MAG: CopG family transcriptional regulator [Thermodesulfobacteriota bacterium]
MTPATSVCPTTVKIDSAMKGRLQALAKAKRRTAHSLLLEAVETFMDREEKREALREQAMQAWQEYELTGLHVTHAEADEWLAKLEKGQVEEPPQCHP